MIHEPQNAAAAGICWLARWNSKGKLHGAGDAAFIAAGIRHPRACAWCARPMADLIRLLEDFNERDGNEHRISGRFRRLLPSIQRELVDRSLYADEGVPA